MFLGQEIAESFGESEELLSERKAREGREEPRMDTDRHGWERDEPRMGADVRVLVNFAPSVTVLSL